MIANIARTSRELFHPVSLRDDEHHALVQPIELRDIVVAQRTQAVNAIRGGVRGVAAAPAPSASSPKPKSLRCRKTPA